MTPIFVPFRNLIIGVVALMLDGWSVSAQEPPRRVLLLYPFDNTQPATVSAGAAIRKRLIERSPSEIDLAAEFLDLARFPGETDELRSARYLAEKYAGRLPEIIMPLNSEALRFAIKYRGIIAPNVPIVFCCVTPDMATAADRPKDITGIYSKFDVGKTIALAQKLQPAARNLVIISGSSEIDRRWLAALRKEIDPYENRFKTEYWIGVPYEPLLDRVAHLPRETIIIFVTVYDDSTGKLLFPAQVVEALARVASAPVYGPSDTYLGRGVVGGYMDSFELMGASAADLALEILAGKNPISIDPQSAQIADFSLTSANCCGGSFPKGICPRIPSCPSSSKQSGKSIATSCLQLFSSSYCRR